VVVVGTGTAGTHAGDAQVVVAVVTDAAVVVVAVNGVATVVALDGEGVGGVGIRIGVSDDRKRLIDQIVLVILSVLVVPLVLPVRFASTESELG
jgi:hypothetical protein